MSGSLLAFFHLCLVSALFQLRRSLSEMKIYRNFFSLVYGSKHACTVSSVSIPQDEGELHTTSGRAPQQYSVCSSHFIMKSDIPTKRGGTTEATLSYHIWWDIPTTGFTVYTVTDAVVASVMV